MIRESSVSHAGTSLRERAKTNYVTYGVILNIYTCEKVRLLDCKNSVLGNGEQ